jgi:hypothetical protein
MKLGDDFLRFVTVRLPKGYEAKKRAPTAPTTEEPQPKEAGETPAQVN